MLLFFSAVAIVLIVSFLCSIFESVLLSLTRPQIEILQQEKPTAGRLLADFKKNMDVPIAAILILNTAAHTVGASVAGASYSSVFDPATLWVFSILFTIAVLFFTEIIPKTLGVSYATFLAAPVAYGIRWLTIMLRPLVVVSEKLSRTLRSDAERPVTSSEEIRLLALLGRSEGVVGPRTAEMIVGATHLRHLKAHDVMLPREKIRFLSADMGREEAMRVVRTSGHSRLPFSPTRDVNDVTGIVLTKNLLFWLLEHDAEEVDWEAIHQEPLIVPASVLLPQLMRTFQESQRHLAVVVDEYGDVVGIATLEDVLEEVVGDIRDESDLPENAFHARADETLVVRAEVDLRKLSARLHVPWQHDLGVTTIGGLVTETLERIPEVGDHIKWNGFRVEVLKADARRAEVLSVVREPDSD
ncbi:MAG: hemolysin family protein [Chromatiales bacterium]|jgi:putative hemolysin|nr:hemolysin family protein [Chromatiales bacterium]MDH3893118.1 hemolysin family protein [Chromatiales bacterium]MDH3932050.1 hemolysin family protein [Chromatiales bacterium]MDH3945070.1 hemolysin family protein [Chromatiales bacterium]MDH4014149.1 hemolysin family protein [Chromatiales bacterium]